MKKRSMFYTGCEPMLKTPLQGDSAGFDSLAVHQTNGSERIW